MKDNFLIGNFMPGYVSSIRFSRKVRPGSPIHPDELRERFTRRQERGRQRRQQYQYGIRFGLISALVIVIGIFSLPLRFSEGETLVATSTQEVVQIEEIQQTQQVEAPPPPPRPAILAVVPDETVLEEVDLQLDASLDLDDAVASNAPPPADASMAEEEESDEIFVVVEEQPTLIGGIKSLYASVSYPEIARRAGMEGRVVVQVVVNRDGSPSDPQILRSAGSVLDPAAVEAVMQQRFTPGRQRNEPVRTRMALTVNFQLTQS